MLESIRDVDITNKSVLCRVDYNVPMENGEIKDDTRIKRSLTTIHYLLDQGAFVILCSHLGRPKGSFDPKLSLKPISDHLSRILLQKIGFVSGVIGDKTKQKVENLKNNYRVVLLENTRFHPGEKTNDEEYSKFLADLADIFVSDAFGAVHRAHASTYGVTRYLPGYAGFLVQEEYERITNAMNNPQNPALAIFGGAKISTKIDVLEHFLEKVNIIALGGGMANTFLVAQGKKIGASLYEEEYVNTAKNIMKSAKKNDIEIILPVDVRIAKTMHEPLIEYNLAKVVMVDNILSDSMILDIGPKTEAKIIEAVIKANTIIWNGPMGVFEKELYREGTLILAKEILKLNKQTVIGGGETAYAINMLDKEEIPKNIHVSTGGGATIELLSGKDLPGLTCLRGQKIED